MLADEVHVIKLYWELVRVNGAQRIVCVGTSRFYHMTVLVTSV